jgi:acyl carrier protein
VTTAIHSLQGELTALFADKLQIDVPSPDTDLLTTGRLDSASMVELLLELEKRFDIKLEMEELEVDHFRSLTTIADFIAAQRGIGGPLLGTH